MKSEQELKEILFDLFEQYEEADDIKDALRSLSSNGEITDEEYNKILSIYERWLREYEKGDLSSIHLNEIQKHGDYDKNETIHIERIDEEMFRLFYEAENYEFVGDKEEVLEELSEHLELKKF